MREEAELRAREEERLRREEERMRYEEERQAREKEIDQLNKTIAALLTERDKPRLQPPKLPTLADGDDVDAVLTRFEQHMVTYDVPRHQ